MWRIYIMNFNSELNVDHIIQSIGIILTVFTIILIVLWNNKQYKQMNEQIKIQNELMKKQFFSEYTKRYQDIILNFPENINDNDFTYDKLDDQTRNKTMRYMRVYFDLCSEEFFLQKNNDIDEKVWKEWKEGIKWAYNKPAFILAWEKVTKESNFFVEFKEFINNEIIKNN